MVPTSDRPAASKPVDPALCAWVNERQRRHRGWSSRITGRARTSSPDQPRPGWQVQDPLSVLSGIDSAVAECVTQLGNARVVGISLSTALHGVVGLDAQYRPLTPLVTWADSRARNEARQLRQNGLARELLHRSGTPVHPMSPLLKLIWFTRHESRLVLEPGPPAQPWHRLNGAPRSLARRQTPL
jgi:sugar (pentulose or hexulose) kinase